MEFLHRAILSLSLAVISRLALEKGWWWMCEVVWAGDVMCLLRGVAGMAGMAGMAGGFGFGFGLWLWAYDSTVVCA